MDAATAWPTTADELVAAQQRLAENEPEPWRPSGEPAVVAGCFACFPRGYSGPGAAGDAGWAAAACFRDTSPLGTSTVTGRAGGGYLPGLLALRLGALLDAAVRALPLRPDVLLVDGTGYDHPRRAGLARHLGAVLDLPTVGVTHRPLSASGDWPADERGARSPVQLDGAVVGYWVRTRAGSRPLVAHAAWRTDAETAAAVVLAAATHRTPTPLREARRLARTARVADRGRETRE
ncbi:MAG: endonuclease V, partial [Streptosporangiales bacterium]|nr:endonuclease V [Streptosporangiales bacterium]